MMISNGCNECIHKNVCGLKDEYKNAIGEVLKKIGVVPDFTFLYLKCTYFFDEDLEYKEGENQCRLRS